MIPPIRRQPVPLECATPPGPARPRTSKSGPARPGRTSGIAPAPLSPDALLASPRPCSPRTHFWHRLRPHAAPSPPRRSPAPEPHPDEKDSFCGRFAGLRPVVLRERVGFQSNAHLPSARSTGNLRARGESGASRRDPGTGETPGTGPGPRSSPGCAPAGPEGSWGSIRARTWWCVRSRGPGGVIGASARPGGVIQAGAGSAARPADALPGRPEDAGCQNLPQRPRPSRNAPEETLIFRASAHRRSRRRAPLWQIRTRPRPGSPQEPHPPHHSNAPQQRIPARNSDAPPAGRLIRVHRPE